MNGPMKFRKKPVVIEALQLRWDTWQEMCNFVGVGRLEDGKPEGTWLHADNSPASSWGASDGRIGIAIPTLEGVMIGVEDDWLIKGVQGEFYPCKPDIFEMTYEEVPE